MTSLSGGAYHMELPDGPQDLSTDVSLISGKIRSMGIDDAEEESTGALIKRDDSMAVANTAGEESASSVFIALLVFHF